MRTNMLVPLAVLALAVGGCSKAEQDKTSHDIQAGADKVAAEAKEAARSPEAKQMGAEIKAAAKDAGQVLKDTAKGAAAGAKEGVGKVQAKREANPDDESRK